MQVSHDLLCLIAIASSWLFGCLSAPLWMPITVAVVLAGSMAFNIVAARTTPQRVHALIGRTSIETGVLLLTYACASLATQV